MSKGQKKRRTTTTSAKSAAQAKVAPKPVPPAIDWEPSVGLTVVGIVCNIIIGTIMDLISNTIVLYVYYGVWATLCIVYGLIVYPRYFTQEPLIKNSKLISFLNGLFGHLFGLLWNHNLTKQKRGISHYVFVALFVFAIVYIIALNIYVAVYW